MAVMLSGWEGNHRSGVVLATRHKLSCMPTYELSGLWQGDEHPAVGPVWTTAPLRTFALEELCG